MRTISILLLMSCLFTQKKTENTTSNSTSDSEPVEEVVEEKEEVEEVVLVDEVVPLERNHLRYTAMNDVHCQIHLYRYVSTVTLLDIVYSCPHYGVPELDSSAHLRHRPGRGHSTGLHADLGQDLAVRHLPVPHARSDGRSAAPALHLLRDRARWEEGESVC